MLKITHPSPSLNCQHRVPYAYKLQTRFKWHLQTFIDSFGQCPILLFLFFFACFSVSDNNLHQPDAVNFYPKLVTANNKNRIIFKNLLRQTYILSDHYLNLYSSDAYKGCTTIFSSQLLICFLLTVKRDGEAEVNVINHRYCMCTVVVTPKSQHM